MEAMEAIGVDKVVDTTIQFNPVSLSLSVWRGSKSAEASPMQFISGPRMRRRVLIQVLGAGKVEASTFGGTLFGVSALCRSPRCARPDAVPQTVRHSETIQSYVANRGKPSASTSAAHFIL